MKATAIACLIVTGIGATVIANSAPAHAASFRSCTTNQFNIADNVTGTSDCKISDDYSQDFLNTNPSTVNEAGFFGLTNWEFGGKIGENSGYGGVGSGQSGTWNISNVIQNSWDNIMLVFKSGQGTNLVGYKVTDGVTSGSWSSPFEKAAFDFNGKNTKDVSHISVYYTFGAKPPVTSVPEPGTIVALSLVSGSILVSRRRKNQTVG